MRIQKIEYFKNDEELLVNIYYQNGLVLEGLNIDFVPIPHSNIKNNVNNIKKTSRFSFDDKREIERVLNKCIQEDSDVLDNEKGVLLYPEDEKYSHIKF